MDKISELIRTAAAVTVAVVLAVTVLPAQDNLAALRLVQLGRSKRRTGARSGRAHYSAMT